VVEAEPRPVPVEPGPALGGAIAGGHPGKVDPDAGSQLSGKRERPDNGRGEAV
jgi:hypothetical protein